LIAAGRIERLVDEQGRRILRLTFFEDEQNLNRRFRSPLLGPPEEAAAAAARLAKVPTPTLAQREALGRRFGVKPNETTEVECAECAMPGDLCRYEPVVGNRRAWRGAVVAAGVEIVPVESAPDGVEVLCRTCRTDVVWSPPPRGTSGIPEERPVPQATGGVDDSGELELASSSPEEESAEVGTVHPIGSARKPTATQARAAVPAADVDEVFAEWIAATERTDQTRLDAKREKCIREALAAYPKDEVVQAVWGIKASPFHQGENPQGKKYTDITLILRDATKIEDFRDLYRRGTGTPGRAAAANVGSFDGQQAGRGQW